MLFRSWLAHLLWEQRVVSSNPTTPTIFRKSIMTCRGYDPKAVKIAKSVKRAAARILNSHQRGEFIRDYVRIAEATSRGSRKEK